MGTKDRAWVEVDIGSLAHNVAQLKAILPLQCAMMPAVKADAYGHGAVIITKALQELGITDFCVATADEAIALRKANIEGQILILGYTPPNRVSDLARYALTQTVVDADYAKMLNDCGVNLAVHIGVDTGMRRLGERSDNIDGICRMWELSHLNITGVYSHLCAADGNSQREREVTKKQIAAFGAVIAALHKRGIKQFKTHLQGSYGILNYPFLQYDYARPGIVLYGALSAPDDRVVSDIKLKPVLSLKARVACVKRLHKGETLGYGLTYRANREMKIAVLAAGYADGIPRELSNKGVCLINGERAAIVGRICMDQMMADVTDIPGAARGDEAILIGKSGEHEITAAGLAEESGTISNEILSRLGGRLERIAVWE